jgi:hypothetical protein
MKKSYCTQPEKDGESRCSECSLCNYGRDCRNKDITFDDFFAFDEGHGPDIHIPAIGMWPGITVHGDGTTEMD